MACANACRAQLSCAAVLDVCNRHTFTASNVRPSAIVRRKQTRPERSGNNSVLFCFFCHQTAENEKEKDPDYPGDEEDDGSDSDETGKRKKTKKAKISPKKSKDTSKKTQKGQSKTIDPKMPSLIESKIEVFPTPSLFACEYLKSTKLPEPEPFKIQIKGKPLRDFWEIPVHEYNGPKVNALWKFGNLQTIPTSLSIHHLHHVNDEQIAFNEAFQNWRDQAVMTTYGIDLEPIRNEGDEDKEATLLTSFGFYSDKFKMVMTDNQRGEEWYRVRYILVCKPKDPEFFQKQRKQKKEEQKEEQKGEEKGEQKGEEKNGKTTPAKKVRRRRRKAAEESDSSDADGDDTTTDGEKKKRKMKTKDDDGLLRLAQLEICKSYVGCLEVCSFSVSLFLVVICTNLNANRHTFIIHTL